MNTKTVRYSAKIELKDAEGSEKRRFRNILANSGEIMESGEIRELDDLYVMGYDSELYKISDLNTNPDKQEEKYAVKAQADHGELVDGELVPSIEKQFGSCKVWLEDDGLHARMYFADEDALADHAYAISKDASYSTGIDWFPDGYYGAGYEIDHPIGILREISMVLTGNDPRAKTIDTKKSNSKGTDGAAETNDGVTTNVKEGNLMNKKLDELTAEERDAMSSEIATVIDKFTAGSSEDEAEPTATDADKKETADAEGETAEAPTESKETEAPAEETKDEEEAEAKETTNDKVTTSPMPILVIKDRKESVKQERIATVKTTDYLKTEAAVAAWGRALLDANGNRDETNANFRKIAKTRDGVDFGDDVTLVPEAVVNAVAAQLSDEGSIFNLVRKTGLTFEIAATPTSEGGATGHVRGKTKTEESITGETRVLTPADLYKLVRLDHSMVKLNGGLGSSAIVKYVLDELPRKLRESIDQGILVGGIKNDDAEGSTAATDFTALISVLSDVKATSTTYAKEYTAASGDNARATLSKAASQIRSGSNRTYITTQDGVTDLENAMAGSQLLFPNGIDLNAPKINGISRIIAPMWLTSTMLGGYSGIVVDFDAYHVVGDTTPENFADYDINVNKYVWEAVACIGGGLAVANSAIGIKAASSSKD